MLAAILAMTLTVSQPKPGMHMAEAVEAVKGSYLVSDTEFYDKNDPAGNPVIERIRFAPYQMFGKSGVLVYHFTRKGTTDAVGWLRGSIGARLDNMYDLLYNKWDRDSLKDMNENVSMDFYESSIKSISKDCGKPHRLISEDKAFCSWERGKNTYSVALEDGGFRYAWLNH